MPAPRKRLEQKEVLSQAGFLHAFSVTPPAQMALEAFYLQWLPHPPVSQPHCFLSRVPRFPSAPALGCMEPWHHPPVFLATTLRSLGLLLASAISSLAVSLQGFSPLISSPISRAHPSLLWQLSAMGLFLYFLAVSTQILIAVGSHCSPARGQANANSSSLK